MQLTDYGLQVDKITDRLVGTFGVSEWPEPRPLQHGYEAVSWQDAPICKHYGLPGEGRHPASHD